MTFHTFKFDSCIDEEIFDERGLIDGKWSLISRVVEEVNEFSRFVWQVDEYFNTNQIAILPPNETAFGYPGVVPPIQFLKQIYMESMMESADLKRAKEPPR